MASRRTFDRRSARLSLGAVSLLGGLAPALAVGCRDRSPAQAGGDGGAWTASSTLTPEQAARVVARVGDRAITLGDVAATLEHMDQFDRLRFQSKERRMELLNEIINVELLAREAEAKGYDKEPATQQQLRAILRDAMLVEARKSAPTPAEIPEADVRAYFQAHRDDFKDPERRRLSVIVLTDEASARAALDAALKATSLSEWGAVVRARSTDPQAKGDGPIDLAGDVGFVSPPGDPRGTNPQVPEPLRAAAFELDAVGAVLRRVVAADHKFYVVRLAQRAEAHERTFAEAERVIRVKLSGERQDAAERALIDELRKEIPVTIDSQALAKVKVVVPEGGLDGSGGSGPK